MTNKRGLVYFLQENATGAIKIGASTTDSIEGRLSSLKTAMPYGSDLLGMILTDNQYELERELHEKYSGKRLNGEFFELSKNEIELCLKKYTSDKQTKIADLMFELLIEFDVDGIDFVKKTLKDYLIKKAENIKIQNSLNVIKNHFKKPEKDQKVEYLTNTQIVEYIKSINGEIVSPRMLGIYLKNNGFNQKIISNGNSTQRVYEVVRL